MTSKIGWVTEADVIVGFDELSDSNKEYSHSQSVWLDTTLEPIREVNRTAGIKYIVSIAGYEYEFWCPEDCWSFTPVSDRAYCSFDDFVEDLETGRWESGDVEVKKLFAKMYTVGVSYYVINANYTGANKTLYTHVFKIPTLYTNDVIIRYDWKSGLSYAEDSMTHNMTNTIKISNDIVSLLEGDIAVHKWMYRKGDSINET